MSKLSEARKNAYMPTFFDDIDVVVTAAGLVTFHFEPNDKNPEGSDVVQYELTFKSEDDKELPQSYRLGDSKYIKITKDGASFDFAPDAKGLRKDSEFVRLLDELDKAGFPTDQLDEDKRGLIDGMVGAGLHIKSEPVKDAEGKTRRHKSKDGREYDTTKIWPTKVNKLPWDDKAGAKKGAAKGKATEKAAAKEEPGEPVDVEQGMKDLITELVANAKDNILQKSGVMSALVKKWEGDARKAAIKLAQDAEFLKSIDGIKFDGSTLTFG